MFQHSFPEIYNELYEFCLVNVPDRFCSYVDFGFSLEDEHPRIFINCTHPYQSRPLESFRDCIEEERRASGGGLRKRRQGGGTAAGAAAAGAALPEDDHVPAQGAEGEGAEGWMASAGEEAGIGLG